MECSAGPGHCEQETTCRVRDPWQTIHGAIRGALAGVSLGGLVQSAGSPVALRRRSEDRMSERERPRAAREPRVPVRLRRPTSRRTRIPKGLTEETVRLISAEEAASRLAARLAAQGVPALPRAARRGARADLGDGRLPDDRLPGHVLLRGAEAEARARRASTRSTRSCCAPTRSSASRSRSRSCLAGVAVDAVFDSVSVATTFKKELEKHGIVFCSFSEAVQKHPELVREVPRLGRALLRQLLRRAQLGGLQRRLLRLHPEGRALPDGALDLLPHQRQPRPASSSAP